MIQFVDPVLLCIPLAQNTHQKWIAKTDRKLDRPFQKIGSLEPMIQFLDPTFVSICSAFQPPCHTGGQLASQSARPLGQPPNQPTSRRPPSQPWWGGPRGWLSGQMANGFVASRPAAARGLPPSALVGHLACHLAMAAWPGLRLPGRLVWLTCSGLSISWLDFAGNLSHLKCSRHQCLPFSPHACDMDGA